jgi:RNA polymerase sigma-54 factor
MGLSPKLEMRAGQQLVMTPQLQQAIRLLQYSNIELAAFVETELERNPLLEHDFAEDRRDVSGDSAADPIATIGDAAPLETIDFAGPSAAAQDSIDIDAGALFPDATPTDIANGDVGPSGGMQSSGWENLASRNGAQEGDGNGLEDQISEQVSLKDHLTQQAGLLVPDRIDHLIAVHIIDSVDEAGYVDGDLATLAEKLGAELHRVERVLTVLQGCDPTGVCARSLAECLKLQLIERDRFDPIMARLIDNLALLGQHNMAALKRVVGVDAEELAEMIGELRALEPKPGLRFGRVSVQPVVPDVYVRPARDGGWHIELNTETLPRVLVNRSYYALVSKTARNDKDKGYLLDCLQSANWLVKSLDQRARTILKVAEEIVRQQDAFLTHGVQHLRPINLKMVADQIKMHESTVSRVTSNKYVATPRGIYELKYFFTSAIQSADSDAEAHSSEAVRHRLKQLIDAEAPSAILSDDKLVELLKAQGIEIARRTVAKYREGMRISSSVQRRREKAMAASKEPPKVKEPPQERPKERPRASA